MFKYLAGFALFAVLLTVTLTTLVSAAPRSAESITLNPSTTGQPTYGSSVSFSVVTTMSYPWVVNRCYQGGVLVYQEYAGLFSQALQQQPFVLGYTPAWTSGAANCVASLVAFDQSGRERVHASTNFNVGP